MDEQQLIQIYPRLYHMAEDGSLESIRARGLLSATALLDLYGIDGPRRFAIEQCRRPQNVVIRSDGLPDAVIRDNKPMSDGPLEKCLQDGLLPSDWYRLLNGNTFFWLHKKRLWKLLGGRAYRNLSHTVITLDTASLVNAHRERILLSPINSGATIMKPQPRGNGTFVPIAAYPYDQRKRGRTVEDALVELVVPYSVPDIAEHMIAAHRIEGGELHELWRRPGVAADDGPA